MFRNLPEIEVKIIQAAQLKTNLLNFALKYVLKNITSV